MKRNNKNKGKKRRMAAVLATALWVSLLSPALTFAGEAGDGAIHIQSQDDLCDLAENCRLDTWSQGKTVVLNQNIALDEEAEDFLPIPTFGGTFEGNDYTISGFSLTGEDSNAGLFGTLQKSAVVNRLKVVGRVTPSGTSDTIGGIAGTNYGKVVDCSFEGAVKGDDLVGGLVGLNETTGQLIDCRFQGTVTGKHYVGGLAGQNTGSLIQCRNDGEINTTAVEVSADLSDLSLLGTTESVPAGTDIGGVAGFSSGVIQSCTNGGNVGYEHMGYNVGGIVGRQSGYQDGCRNDGIVKGRKDVGGIAGQLEPQMTLRYTEDLLDKLWAELDTLQGLTDQVTAHTQSSSHTISSSFDSLSDNVSAAKDAVSGLSGALTQWGNENIGQINDVSARVSWVISQTEPVLNNVSQSISYLQKASDLLQQAIGKVDVADAQGAAAAAELEQASQNLQQAADYGESCIRHLQAARETAQKILGSDTDTIGETINSLLNELKAAGEDGRKAKDALSSAFSHGDKARDYLTQMGATGVAALEDLGDANAQLNDALSSLSTGVDQLNGIITTLADEPAIAFTPVDSNITSHGDALDAALSQMIGNADSLNSSLTSASDTLLGDMQAINSQIGVITDLMQQEITSTKEKEAGDSFEDVSDEDTGEPSAGKIHNGINRGEVQGDVNVAGIVGSMSVEYDFDPEDDLTKEGNRSLNFQYKTLAVVTGCTNEGTVSAKKDDTGGIVGRMDLGAVKACESYGQVESAGGDYVGGIAGLCRSTIRNCFVKCSLSGGDYIGGVTGSSEDNTVVSGCYTLVEIADGGRCTGAICGTETGSFSGNYYVSDTLAGLGRIGYTGKAEPMTFEELCQVSGLPEQMTQFTLRFLVEDEEIKSYDFSYGDSFGSEVFPEIPVKDGYYASWDTQDLSDLHFDKTVTAEYVRYVLALPSQASRSSGRSVFLMEGDFDDDATLTVTRVEKPERIGGKAAVEQWHLSCSDSSQESYTVRYLSPEETTEGYSVFVQENGKWKKADCSTFGSYLVFSVPEAEADVAMVTATNVWLWCIIGCAALLLVILLIVTIKKRRVKKASAMVQNPNEAKKHDKAERKPVKKKKWLIALLLFLLLVIIALWVLVGGKLAAGKEACQLLQELAGQSEGAMTMDVSLQLDDELINTEMDILQTKVDGQEITCIQNNDISLYYADDAIILENGKAYKVSDLHPDYSQLPAQAAELFETISFSTSRSGGKVTCQMTAEGENAGKLLKVLLPNQAEDLSDTQKLTIELTTSGDQIQSLRFVSKGTLADDEKTVYSLEAQLKPETMDEALVIPDPVREAISSGKIQGQAPISEDLFRLFSAWKELGQKEPFTADVDLGVECGPVSLHGKMKYGQALVDGSKISCVRKDDLSVYFSEGRFCDQNGVLLTAEDNELTHYARLLEVLKQICLNGEFDCTDTGNNTWIYTLTLDESGMKAVAYAAAPELESLPVTLSAGSVQVRVSGNRIQEISCTCSGGVDGLEDAAPGTVSVKLDFAHNGSFDVPHAVKEQLVPKEVEESGK